MPLTKLQFRPGINRDITSYSNEGGWRDGDKIRFRLGFPEKIGGWQKFSEATYQGAARALHNWIGLDGSNFLGVGTHLKYYVEEGTSFNDITPIRQTTAAGDVTFAASETRNFDSTGGTTHDSTILVVTDASHGCQQNDFVIYSQAGSLGGNITSELLNGEHQVTRVIDADTYEITLNVIATTTGVTSTSVSGTSTGTATFTGITQDSTSGSGTGVEFTIRTDGAGNYIIDEITKLGIGYAATDTITIEGTQLGGATTANDLTITVSTIGGDTAAGGGTIDTVTFSGTGTGKGSIVPNNTSAFTNISGSVTGPSGATIYGGGATPITVYNATSGSGTDFLGLQTFTGTTTISVATIRKIPGSPPYDGINYNIGDPVTASVLFRYTVPPSPSITSIYSTVTADVALLEATTYTGVTQSSTSGSGRGAVFSVTVPQRSTASAAYSVVTVTDGGTGYAASDTITISGANLGGTSPTNDLTITVGSVDGVVGEYQINVGLNTTVGGTGWGAGLYSGLSGHTPASTTLSANITNVVTTIGLTSTSGFPTSGFVVIAVPSPGTSEIIQYTGVSGNNLTGCSRGMFGTPAVAHSSGAAVTESTYGWGMPSPLTTTTQIRLWSHDNFGEDLLINPRDSFIYYWDKSGGAGARAVELSTLSGTKTSVPTVCKQIMVSDRDRHVLAFGCDGINASSSATQGDEIQDPLLIRFSNQEDPLDWYPTATNTAGDLRLGSGSTFVKAIETKREILVWTDTALSSLRFIGPPFTFGLQQLANNITIIGPNAAVASEDFVFWMGLDNFYVYAGQTAQLPCTVKDKVFADINLSEFDKVYGAVNSEFGEVMWLYPSANSVENNRYVVYNYMEKLWYFGTLDRTAWLDRGTRDFPIAAEGGYLYNHEFGYDADGQPMGSFIESAAMDIGDGDHFTYIRRVIPDLTFLGSTAISTPQATFTIKGRNFPGEDFSNTAAGTATRTSVSPVEEYTTQLDLRMRGRSFALRVDSNALGSRWKLGSPRVDMRQDGRR